MTAPAAMAEISQALAGEILTMPDLSDPEWDTYAMIAEVSDEAVGVTAYRYTEAGPPMPTAEPEVTACSGSCTSARVAPTARRGTSSIMKIHRDTAELVMNFVSGEAAEMWRITPENIGNLPEMLRPRAEDFDAV